MSRARATVTRCASIERDHVKPGLVLATLCTRSMRALRWVAIASNLAFIAYGYLGSLAPVLLLHMLLLHMLLLPVNVHRLAQLRGGQARSERIEGRGKRAPTALNCRLFRQSAR
jgi:hypothetical protein